MQHEIAGAPGLIAIPSPAVDMSNTQAPAVWKRILIDSLGFVLVVWSIPAAILVVGTPIVMAAALVIGFVRWVLQ